MKPPHDSAARENFLCILQKYVNSSGKKVLDQPLALLLFICHTNKWWETDIQKVVFEKYWLKCPLPNHFMPQNKTQRENSCTVTMKCFQEQEVVHCVHSYPVLSTSQVTKAATEEWITESEVTGTSHCSGAGLPPKLASQGGQGTEAGDIFGYHYPHQEPVQLKGFMSHSPVLFFSPSCSQPVQELVPNPSPLSHPPLVHLQSIGKVSWTHLGIGIWKIEFIQTVFPCIQETSDC